jgi:hypothetical protein
LDSWQAAVDKWSRSRRTPPSAVKFFKDISAFRLPNFSVFVNTSFSVLLQAPCAQLVVTLQNVGIFTVFFRADFLGKINPESSSGFGVAN